MTRQRTNHPANAKVNLSLTEEEWNILIPFVTSQIDHVQINLVKGRLRHRIVRHLDNAELMSRLQAIEMELRTQFYFQGRENK